MSISSAQKRLLVVLGLASVAVIAADLSIATREPTLEGQSVRSLVRQAGRDWTAGGFNHAAEDVFQRNGSKAVPGLVQIIGSGRHSFNSYAAGVLRAHPQLYLHLPTAWVRERADRAIQEADREATDRELAVVVCASLNQKAKAAHTALLAACQDPARGVRKEAAKALVRTDVDPAIAVPVLSGLMLQDGDSTVRYWAAASLGLLHENAKAAVPALRRATNDSNAWVASRAAEALEKAEKAIMAMDGRQHHVASTPARPEEQRDAEIGR